MPRQAKRSHELTKNDGSRRVPAKISSGDKDIAKLAYLHWQDRGCPIGSPEEDWSWAEQDLKSEQRRTV
jgi:hypothetical protein